MGMLLISRPRAPAFDGRSINRISGWRLGSAGLAIASSALCGCALVDQFGERAITYNEQMQAARSTTILTNVLRSGFNEPLQFSEVSTVTGQAVAQGTFATAFPGPRAAGARLYSLNPSFQTSGGPSFAVANLNNQEFFNGLNTPLTIEQIANYVNNGSTRAIVLFLAVSAIDYDYDEVHVHFESDPRHPGQFRQFQSVLLNLINAQLTFQRSDPTTNYGPPLTANDVVGKDLLASRLKTPPDAKTPPLVEYRFSRNSDKDAVDGLTDEEKVHLKGHDSFYRLASSDSRIRFCFAPQKSAAQKAHDDWEDNRRNGKEPSLPFGLETPVRPDGRAIPVRIGTYGKEEKFFVVGTSYQCLGSKDDVPGQEGIQHLKFTLRSVRGIFALLGVMAEAELKDEDQQASLFDFPNGDGAPSSERHRVFGVRYDDAGKASSPQGLRVKVTSDFDGDFSSRSIQLLSELMALNSSAKSFPAPNVIPFFTP